VGSKETVTFVSDVDTRSTDSPFLLENLECIRQKAHLMPHARAFHGDQRDAPF